MEADSQRAVSQPVNHAVATHEHQCGHPPVIEAGWSGGGVGGMEGDRGALPKYEQKIPRHV